MWLRLKIGEIHLRTHLRWESRNFELWWRPDPHKGDQAQRLDRKPLSNRSLSGFLIQISSYRNPTSHTLGCSLHSYSHWLGSMEGIRAAWILYKYGAGCSTCYYVPHYTKHNWTTENPQYFQSYPWQMQLYTTHIVADTSFLLCYALPLCWCICYRIYPLKLLLVVINLFSFFGCEALASIFSTFVFLTDFSVVPSMSTYRLM